MVSKLSIYIPLSKVILQETIKLRLSQKALLMKCKNSSGTLSLSRLGVIDPNPPPRPPPPNIMITLLCNVDKFRKANDNNQMFIKNKNAKTSPRSICSEETAKSDEI